MKVVGVGTDLVDVAELRASAERQPGKYLERIFTPAEIKYAESQADPIQCLAGKLAAKEALVKCLRSGWSDEVDWLHIAVLNTLEGAPYLELSHGASDRLAALGGSTANVSISHLPTLASAFVIVTG